MGSLTPSGFQRLENSGVAAKHLNDVDHIPVILPTWSGVVRLRKHSIRRLVSWPFHPPQKESHPDCQLPPI